ncbi:MAG TPA: ShlB/FhaC/HecB family hemolysin secretion/activation protein [Spongiibacteraceae bacterium]
MSRTIIRYHCRKSFLAVMALLSSLCGAVENPIEKDAAPIVFVGIELTHMTYYPRLQITAARVQQEMAQVIATHRGVIDFATVQDVASRITALYRSAGFVFTRAYIPQQRAHNGAIEVRLLEGTLSSIDILDNKSYSAAELTRPFADLTGKVVYSPDMEEAMALLNDYPGLNAFGFYSVGEEPGSTRLNVRVQRERDWTGALHADNYGAELTGHVRLLAELEKFNPTGNADHLRVAALQTVDPKNATYGLLNYDIPVLDQRSQLALRASTDTFVVSRGGNASQQIELSGKAHSAAIEFKRQLKRSNAANRSWHIGIVRDISTSAIKDVDINLDQKSWETNIGFDLDNFNRRSNSFFATGIDVVAGRYDAIDVPGQTHDYRFAHGYAGYSRGVRVSSETHQLKLDIDWQYTHDLLPAISQYALTGPTRLRGFLPGDFSADSGAIGIATWVLPKWALTAEKGVNKPDLTMSLFAEYGYGVQNIPAANINNDWGYMSDAGAAWLFTIGSNLSATITVAMPLSHRINYQDNHVAATRAWIELLWRFH